MAIGWGNLAGGIGEILGKASTYIPGKIEKLKNERLSLAQERSQIERINMDITNPEHRKKAMRLSDIISRINYIDSVLGNKAQD